VPARARAEVAQLFAQPLECRACVARPTRPRDLGITNGQGTFWGVVCARSEAAQETTVQTLRHRRRCRPTAHFAKPRSFAEPDGRPHNRPAKTMYSLLPMATGGHAFAETLGRA